MPKKRTKRDIFLRYKIKDDLKKDMFERSLRAQLDRKKIKILKESCHAPIKIKRAEKYVKKALHKATNINDDGNNNSRQMLITSKKLYEDYSLLAKSANKAVKGSVKGTIKIKKKIKNVSGNLIDKNNSKTNKSEIHKLINKSTTNQKYVTGNTNKKPKNKVENRINKQINRDTMRREIFEKSRPNSSTIQKAQYTNPQKRIKSKDEKILTRYINQRVSRLDKEKEDNSNNSRRMVTVSKDIYNDYKYSAKALKGAYEVSIKAVNITKNVLMITIKLMTSKMLIFILPIMLAVFVIGTVFGAQIAIFPTNFVMCGEEYRKYIIDEINTVNASVYDETSSGVKTSGYDDVKVNSHDLGIDYRYILCLLAVKNQQEFKMPDDEIKEIYKMFVTVSEKSENYTEIERTSYVDETGTTVYNETEVTKTRLIVNYSSKSVLEVADELNFDNTQIDWLNILLSNEVGESLHGSAATGKTSSLTDEEITEMYKLIDEISDPKRKEIINKALSLWGVTYYKWGGKAQAGDTPLGLDCSGFVDWVYKTATGYEGLSEGGTSFQFYVGETVSANSLKAGDLGFWKLPSEVKGTQSDANHVGIYIGTLDNGKKVYVHCQGGTGVTVNSFNFQYFKSISNANFD